VTTDEIARPVRRRVPRAEAMAKILAATIELLREAGPESVGVRDIAERSGHNQRFVVEWFGSKVELFRQAFLHLAEEFAAGGTILTRRSAPQPELVVIVRLMNWLVAQEPTVFRDTTERPLLTMMATVYRERFGLDDRVSQLMAQRLVAGLISTVLFGDLLRMTPRDLEDQIVLDTHLAQLLADHGLPD
jgi:AcrR family transcriptional regulator